VEVGKKAAAATVVRMTNSRQALWPDLQALNGLTFSYRSLQSVACCIATINKGIGSLIAWLSTSAVVEVVVRRSPGTFDRIIFCSARILEIGINSYYLFSQLLSDEVMTPGNSKAGNRSPYTFHDIDAAIAHLEAVLDKEGASSLFSRAYWRERVLQASSTTGLAPKQQQRLHRLLARIETF